MLVSSLTEVSSDPFPLASMLHGWELSIEESHPVCSISRSSFLTCLLLLKDNLVSFESLKKHCSSAVTFHSCGSESSSWS